MSRKGRIDKVLVKSISRFARSTTECLETIRELKSLGISIWFEEHGIDTKIVTSEMAALKEQREKISVQLRNNKAAQEHVYTMAAVPDQEDHHLTEWDEEMTRQLVHTVKVISADHIRVCLNDGTEIDQEVYPKSGAK